MSTDSTIFELVNIITKLFPVSVEDENVKAAEICKNRGNLYNLNGSIIYAVHHNQFHAGTASTPEEVYNNLASIIHSVVGGFPTWEQIKDKLQKLYPHIKEPNKFMYTIFPNSNNAVFKNIAIYETEVTKNGQLNVSFEITIVPHICDLVCNPFKNEMEFKPGFYGYTDVVAMSCSPEMFSFIRYVVWQINSFIKNKTKTKMEVVQFLLNEYAKTFCSILRKNSSDTGIEIDYKKLIDVLSPDYNSTSEFDCKY